jgi:hypothetical protein
MGKSIEQIYEEIKHRILSDKQDKLAVEKELNSIKSAQLILNNRHVDIRKQYPLGGKGSGTRRSNDLSISSYIDDYVDDYFL